MLDELGSEAPVSNWDAKLPRRFPRKVVGMPYDAENELPMSSPMTSIRPVSLEEINAMQQPEFTSIFGPLFEHSPWVAEQTWPERPFRSPDDLISKLDETVRKSSFEMQVELIQAHPDLAGRLARLGTLTAESTREQASAGLDRLSLDEEKMFEDYNAQYQSKFAFPFVICARLNDKKAILLAFQHRLKLSRTEEIEIALGEIKKIAALRLASMVGD